MSKKREYDDDVSAAEHFLFGALSRMVSAILMCPADTIKTRLQFQGRRADVKKYDNFFHAFKVIYREEGLLVFARGLPARLIYLVPAAGISFLSYEQFLYSFRKPKEKQNFVWDKILPVFGITFARFIGTSFRTPFDIVKQRMQVQGALSSHPHYQNTVVAAIEVSKLFGFRVMFNSIIIAFMRDAPFSLIYFTTYELAKRLQSKFFGGQRRLNLMNHLVSGACAGAVGAVLTCPMDVVKTRLQTEVALPPENRRYKGIFNAFVTIIRTEGFRGLTKGVGARVLYLTPSAAIVWGCYESLKSISLRFFHKDRKSVV